MGYNEADTRAKLINPNLHEAGWSEDLIRREITAGTEFQKEKKRAGTEIYIEYGYYKYAKCFFSGGAGK